jgi:hypothetical protein
MFNEDSKADKVHTIAICTQQDKTLTENNKTDQLTAKLEH